MHTYISIRKYSSIHVFYMLLKICVTTRIAQVDLYNK